MADWNIPDSVKYTENDEWIMVSGDTAKVGLTDYAQDQLSDIVFVDLEVEAGGEVAKGAPFATVESVKAASDVYAPASGTVVATNGALESTPERINSDPYGEGWLIEIRLSNPAELNDLLDAAAYTRHCEEREH
ncbi:MAG TPA: glycine cleavage system protein GcvH [Aggregatilineaceae bacterium]|nr:glycine cleavage system protein GcvH [Aggregatilineaceae bacterium]